MNRTVGLRPALLVGGIYALAVGIMNLFPSLAGVVFARKVLDPAIQSGWGSSLIALGILALAAAADVGRYGRLAGVFVLGLLITSFDLLYFFLTGAYDARSVIVPFILNVLLIAWIWSVRPKR